MSKKTFEEVKREIEKFRKNRKGRGKFPEEIWQSVASLYPEHSISKLHNGLHLEWSKLKQICQEKKTSKTKITESDFVELTPQLSSSQSSIVFERKDGALMTINSVSAEEISILATSFLSGSL